jgi:hypothetical protein
MAEDTGPDVDGLIVEIKSGEYDRNLVKIIEAVRDRFAHGTTAQRWKVEWDGREFTEDDLTLNEAAIVEKLTGTSWGLLNPASSANECRAIVAACLHERDGVKLDAAVKQAGSKPMRHMVDSIGAYEVDAAPKD